MPRRYSHSPTRSRSRDDRRRRAHRYKPDRYRTRPTRHYDDDSYSSESDLDIISDYSSASGSELERRPKKHSAGGKIVKTEITGGKVEAKTLFKGPRRCKCCSPWTDEIPEHQDHVVKPNSAEHGDFAILIRKTSFAGMPWEIEEISIYSPHIINLLNDTLGIRHDWVYSIQSALLTPPYKPLVHGWTELMAAIDKAEDSQAKEHYQLFKDTFLPLLQPTFDLIKDIKKKGEIPYSHLWTIFTPEMLVTWSKNGQRFIGKIDEIIEGYSEFSLTIDQVDWNGTSFGISKYNRNLKGYKGSKKILELEAVPLDFLTDAEQLKKEHIERGQKFEELAGYNYVQYNGPCWDIHWQMGAKKDIKERMVIDKFAYYFFQGLGPPPLSKVLITPPKREIKERNDNTPLYDHHGNILIPPPRPISPDRAVDIFDVDGRRMPTPMPRGRGKPRKPVALLDPEDEENPKKLNDEQLMITVPFLHGFNMREKRWYRISISGVSPMTRTDCFNNLVLPNQEKDLLLAFAKSKMKGDMKFDDFVDGKGKGVIVLLSGSPGVGKTLTAESIADKLQVPLYTLSAGEIGTAPNKVEQELKITLDKCVMWNAILLLDEADVFLEKRELDSLARNELVSIFLRQLEYYEGMMILTTNRVGAIDQAFESRIDVSIDYPELTPDLRLQIWSKFLFRDEEVRKNIREKDLVPISELPLNGRQIKSAVKTACLLASSKEEVLDIDHIRTTLKLHRTQPAGPTVHGYPSTMPQMTVGNDGLRNKNRKDFDWNF